MYPLMLLNTLKSDSQLIKINASNSDEEMIESVESGFLGLLNVFASNNMSENEVISSDSTEISDLKLQAISFLEMFSNDQSELETEVQEEAVNLLQKLETDVSLTDQDVVDQIKGFLQKLDLMLTDEDVIKQATKLLKDVGVVPESIKYETENLSKDDVVQQETKDQNPEILDDSSYKETTKVDAEFQIRKLLTEQPSNKTVSGDNISQPMTVTSESLPDKPITGEVFTEETQQTQIETNKFDIVSQIVEKASASVKEGKYEMQVTLKPEYLGKVSIEMAMEEQGMVVKILAPNHSVESAISSQMIQLEQDLKAQGIEVLRMEVAQQPTQDLSQMPNQSQEFSRQSKQNYSAKDDVDTLEELSDTLSMIEQTGLYLNSVEFRA